MSEKKAWVPYWEKLRDPRWQRKRLEVMERESFICQHCGDDGTTLNVHHTYYERGRAPWEYPSESLKCLCEPCHETAQEQMKILKQAAAQVDCHVALIAIGFMRGYSAFAASCREIPVGSFEEAMGVGLVWGFDAEEIISMTHDGIVSVRSLQTTPASKPTVWSR